MNGGYVTYHNAEAVEAFFGPYQQDHHVGVRYFHLRVEDMKRANREIVERVLRHECDEIKKIPLVLVPINVSDYQP